MQTMLDSGAIFDGECAGHVLKASVEFMVLVEAALHISYNLPHDLCAAFGDDQAMSTESHSAFWAIPQVVPSPSSGGAS